MKIFSSEQFRQWDQFTIANEPVQSIDLMERAAMRCSEWLIKNFPGEYIFHIFCGPGNNGGDGLAIARQLQSAGKKINTYILDIGNPFSIDFRINLQRFHDADTNCFYIKSSENFPEINENDILIDALFGSGLNRPLEGLNADLVIFLNAQYNITISIDLPSGLFDNISSEGNTVVSADHTLSFQAPKLAFMVPDNEDYVGDLHILDIGLSKNYYDCTDSPYEWIQQQEICSIYKKRKKFSHKGDLGHAALLCGSYGMLGAAILAGKSCLRSGVGKMTCITTPEAYPILQVSIPESVFILEDSEHFFREPGQNYQAIGVGPGIGRHRAYPEMMDRLFHLNKPLILDADALNCLAEHPELLKIIPRDTIITPHLKEFERLFGKTHNGFDRLKKAVLKSEEAGIYIILKGHYSLVATPLGKGFFNSTGNPGMATAGSGDVLTGILTGLRARGYKSLETCILGTYLHGLSGDKAAADLTEEAIVAGDIVQYLPQSFKFIIENCAKSH